MALKQSAKENDFFPTPIITPSTKASEGHDEDISKEEIIQQKITTASEWEILSQYALALFERGKALADRNGLILADTKYEFGILNDKIYLMDEIHTPDSSRYFIKDGFDERQLNGERQKQLSKEFVREWLIQNDFMGKEGQVVPTMSNEWIAEISNRYIELYEKLIGEPFIPVTMPDDQVYESIVDCLQKL